MTASKLGMGFAALVTAVLLTAASCQSAKVRNDPSPAPLDVNYHTVLLDACGGTALGQAGCSFAADEVVSGSLTVFTPLAGTIALISRECGVDRRDYHAKGGAYTYPLSELLPKGPSQCTIAVYTTWELPKDVTSEYPLRGQSGKVYLRRRASGSAPPQFTWVPGLEMVGGNVGVSFGQFRARVSQVPAELVVETAFQGGEPILLKAAIPKPIARGFYSLEGCGNGVKQKEFTNLQTFEFSKEELMGDNPRQGSCVMFGYILGEDGQDYDLMVGLDVFDYRNVKLAADAYFDESGKLCFAAENTVSLVVVGDKAYNELSKCVAPITGYIAFMTAQGRASYAFIDAGAKKIKWVR